MPNTTFEREPTANKNTCRPAGFSTGLPVLDTLLCGEESAQDDTRGITEGAIVLIRGEPGSGKTTLAMQILSQYVVRQSAKSDKRTVAFVSLEEESVRVIERMASNYKLDFGDRSLVCIDASAIAFEVESAKGEDRAGANESTKHNQFRMLTTGAVLVIAAASFGMLSNPALNIGGQAALFAIPKAWAHLKQRIAAAVKRLSPKDFTNSTSREESPKFGLVVVDSLNAYINLVSQSYPDVHPRVVLAGLCEHIRAAFGEDGHALTIIFTDEYHHALTGSASTISESFYCDTEICLRSEPIRVPAVYETNIQSPIGYNLNSLLPDDADTIESRSFCRVLKNRHNPNQSRRCAYDIVPGYGFKLYETYPGDGKLMLFAENAQQRSAWGEFFGRDIPDSYPALRTEVFNRTALQSVYEGQRRLRNVPLKTDMHLASFDAYWLSWYRDLKLRRDVDEALGEWRQKEHIPEREYCQIVAAVVRMFKSKGNQVPLKEGADHAAVLRTALDDPANEDGNRLRERTREILSSRLDPRIALRQKAGPAKWTAEYARRVRERYMTKVILKPKRDRLMEVLKDKSPGLLSHFSSFLRPIPANALALFGEMRSRIIPELAVTQRKAVGAGWTPPAEDGSDYRAWWLESEWLGIPYDANISFVVCRKDLLHKLSSTLDESVVRREILGLLALEKTRIGILCQNSVAYRKAAGKQQASYAEWWTHAQPDPQRVSEDENPYGRVINILVDACTKNIMRGGEPRTWEELIVLCRLLKHGYAIETRSFNTYVATILEMSWNCGAADICVDPEYESGRGK
jgi:RecA/RadA recombinase